jgi:Domain of unknown function (DUF4328)
VQGIELEGRARWAIGALVATVVSNLAAIGADVLTIDLMGHALAGDELRQSSLEADDLRQTLSATAQFAALIAAAVFFIRWFNRAHESLRALGAQPRYKDWWAIVGWFVPILNLWRPKQIANDIWRGTDPTVRSMSLVISATRVPLLLGVWWVAWLVSGSLTQGAARVWWDTTTSEEAAILALIGDDGPAEDLRTAAIFDVVASSTGVVAALLAILVVRTLTARHVARQELVVSLYDEPVPAQTEPPAQAAAQSPS